MVPEEQMLVSVMDTLIRGKPLFDALRSIRDKLQLVSIGIEEITLSDRFVLNFFANHTYSGTGTLTRYPEDILDFQRELYEARK